MKCIEYEFIADDGFNICFKAFPHLINENTLIEKMEKFAGCQVRDDITKDYDNDPYLAIFTTFANHIYNDSHKAVDMKTAVAVLNNFDIHIKLELKIKGLYINWCQFQIERLNLKNDCII